MNEKQKTLRKILLFLLAFLLAGRIGALGKQDSSEYQDVDGVENWQKTIDISEAEPGEYNLVVKGEDSAGNVGYAGPYNLMVDPDSTIPGVSISYPVAGERLGSSFSVVGVAWDDDEVGRVELAVDEGDFHPVEGRDYWSWHYERESAEKSLSDGPHTIRVRTVDIDGNTSAEVSMGVNIDTAAPVFTIESLEEGSIVSGKINIAGTVTDENGIKTGTISGSLRGEAEKLALKKEKDSNIYRFSHNLDTGELEDGPRLVSFSATDETGSTGSSAFLLFVDNTAPELSFLYPEDEEVNGKITVVGRAEDAVGIEKLSYKTDNGQEGDIDLPTGTTVWKQSIDYTGEKSGKKKISFKLSDTAGNTIRKELSFQLDGEADLPRIHCSEYLGEPLEFRETPQFSGWVEDDDGPVSTVEYMIKGSQEWEKIPSAGSWFLELENFPAGEGVLEVRATDSNGTTGEELSIPFVRIPLPGRILLENYKNAEEQVIPWQAGRVFAHGEKVELQGRVKTSDPRIGLYYHFGDGEEKKTGLAWDKEKGLARFAINLPAKEEAGRHELFLRVIDSRQREVTTHTAWYREAPADENGTVPSLELREDIIFDIPGEKESPTLFDGMQIHGWIPGGTIRSVSIDPVTDTVQINTKERFFSLLAAAETVLSELTLEVEDNSGKNYNFQLPGLITDGTAPRIVLADPGTSDRMKDVVLLRGEVVDADEVRNLKASLSRPDTPDASPRMVDIELKGVEGEKGSYRFEQEISLPAEGRSGPVFFHLEAEDRAGNTGTEQFTLVQDGKNPEFHLVVPKGTRPQNSDWAGEQTVICGYVNDASGTGSVQVGEESFPVENNFFSGQINFSGFESLPESFVLQAEDPLENRTFLELPLNLDIDRWKPEVQIHVPAEGAAFTGAFSLSGSAVDREGVERIEYRINDGEWISHSVKNTFSIPISFSSLKADLNTVTVRAFDINGYTSDEVSREFRISLQEPTILIEKPALEEVVRDEIVLKGKAEDENGIALVEVSFDNGNTYQKALVKEENEWSYGIDSRLLSNGTNPILLHVEDAAGVSSYFSSLLNVDNSPPELEVRSPEGGQVLYDTLYLEGRVHDSVEVRSINLTLKAVDESVGQETVEGTETENSATGGKTFFEWEFKETGVLLKEIDISALPRGNYLFNLTVLDGAGNKADLSRMLELQPPEPQAPQFVSPLPGEELGPFFTIEGRLPLTNLKGRPGERQAQVMLLVDGAVHSLIEPGEDGRFRTRLGPEDNLTPGIHELGLRWENGETGIESAVQKILYRPEGLWITTDSIPSGEHIGDLSTITGSAGYFEVSPDSFESRKAEKEYYRTLKGKKPVRIEISFDDGRSFQEVKGTEVWSYRVYRQNHPEGEVRALIRAVSEMEAAYTRLFFTVDTTPPRIALYEKIEDGHFNKSLYVSGHAFDESGLSDLQISLRPGDKTSYGTPSFIQGMYFDATALGATWFTTGLGMTFMDDNVKLQVQYGYAPEGYTDPDTGITQTARFGGQVLGSKLLANILYLPYDFFLGPRFQQLSASFALGANFSYFNNPSEDSVENWGIILAGVIGQLEFAKYEFRDRRFLKYISVFAEGQLWLISSDVEPDIAVMPSFGIRLGLF